MLLKIMVSKDTMIFFGCYYFIKYLIPLWWDFQTSFKNEALLFDISMGRCGIIVSHFLSL